MTKHRYQTTEDVQRRFRGEPPPAPQPDTGTELSPAPASEQAVLAAPLSFDGSTRRIWRWYHPRVTASQGWPRAGRWTLLWTMLILAWTGVLTWYAALTGTFGIGIIVLVVYRLVRRSQRRGRRDQARHAELLASLHREEKS